MRFLSVRHSHQGFTLVETTIIVAMIGILAAVSAPSWLSWNVSRRVKRANVQVQGALLEAQQQAMMRSTTCTITLNTTANPPRIEGPCLVTGTRTLADVALRASATTLVFDYQGVITSPAADIVTVVSLVGDSTEQHCTVMTYPIGLVRSGTYAATDTTETLTAACD